MEDFQSHYFRGVGPLFIAPFADGANPDDLLFIGDVGTVTLQPDISRGDVVSNVNPSRAIGSSWLDRVAYTLTINMRSIKAEHVAQNLQGQASPLVAASETGQSHTATTGRMILLGHGNVSNVVVSDDPDTTTYVDGTDYVLHAREGLVEILSTGSISDDDPLLIDYDYAAQTRVTTEPGNQAYQILFSGYNTANSDKHTRCHIYRAKLDPGAFDLISDGAAESAVSGAVEQDFSRSAGDRLFSWLLED